MQILSKLFRGMLVIMLIAGMAATLEAEEVKLKIVAPWEAAGHVYKVGPQTLQFIGIFQGIMYIEEAGKGELDAAALVCPATQEINAANGQTIAHGRCMITVSKGHSVYAEFTCKGTPDGCQGKFNITAGEGPLKGIKGSSDMVIRSELGAVAVNLDSGSVIHAAEGLAVWPNLVYTLPSK